MIEDKLTKRYVKALMGVLTKDQYQLVLQELVLVEELIVAIKELSLILASPLVDYFDKLAVLDAIFSKMELTEITRGFFKVLLKNKRLFLLAKIIERYKKEIYAELGKVVVNVDLAVKVSDDVQKQLMSVFEKYTGKDVDLQLNHDPGLLAGLVARIEDNVIDTSLLGQLKKIEKELVSNN